MRKSRANSTNSWESSKENASEAGTISNEKRENKEAEEVTNKNERRYHNTNTLNQETKTDHELFERSHGRVSKVMQRFLMRIKNNKENRNGTHRVLSKDSENTDRSKKRRKQEKQNEDEKP